MIRRISKYHWTFKSFDDEIWISPKGTAVICLWIIFHRVRLPANHHILLSRDRYLCESVFTKVSKKVWSVRTVELWPLQPRKAGEQFCLCADSNSPLWGDLYINWPSRGDSDLPSGKSLANLLVSLTAGPEGICCEGSCYPDSRSAACTHLSWSPCDPLLWRLCIYTCARLRQVGTAHVCPTCLL